MKYLIEIQNAAKSKDAFHINEALNGIPVEAWRNQPNHSNYNSFIKNKLDDLNIGNPSPEEAYNGLENLIQNIKTWITNNPNSHLNEISF